MSFLEIAQERYATKKYNPNEKIAGEVIEELKAILRLSPSSINSQPWKFTIVGNDEVKSKLAKVSYHNEEKINQASHIVVFHVINDVTKFENENLSQLPEGAVNYYKQHLQSLGEEAIQTWMQHQVYLALGFFLSACGSMRIDSTPMEGIKPDEYNNILPYEGYTALFAVAIGRRDAEDFNQPSLKPKSRRSQEEITISL
ncbi:nitroreductase family protein [Sphingobacterium wenxiniae]|uniref:Nitroreductase / dihydropteridine reductase n=1 Tax=Sphingobacterium wenxiniae TaxID=683125 RepID=A0A1I6S604_9SPHI|nr:nitroreductase family protein [Sphingobacterium wenxiniae]SFS72371.1 nitroreductase / dihydropteridine reductase [Sphingobacterium wenxiniae]